MGFLPESSKSARKRLGGKKCYVESILVSNKGGGRNLGYDGGVLQVHEARCISGPSRHSAPKITVRSARCSATAPSDVGSVQMETAVLRARLNGFSGAFLKCKGFLDGYSWIGKPNENATHASG